MNYDVWWENFTEINRLDPGTRWRTDLILQQIDGRPIKTLLDVGCGAGELLGAIKEKYPKITLFGTDVSRRALKKLDKRGMTKRTFVLDLGVPKRVSAKYDLVVCSEVIEHLNDWRAAVKILSQVCQGKGYVILTTQSGKVFPHHIKLGHIRHFRVEELTAELTRNNLRILTAKTLGRPFMDVKNYLVSNFMPNLDRVGKDLTLIQRLAMRIFYYLYRYASPLPGPQIVILAQKR